MTLGRDYRDSTGPLHVIDEIADKLCQSATTLCGLTLECPQMAGYPEGRDTMATLAAMERDEKVCRTCSKAEMDAYQDDLSMDFD